VETSQLQAWPFQFKDGLQLFHYLHSVIYSLLILHTIQLHHKTPWWEHNKTYINQFSVCDASSQENCVYGIFSAVR
jgi:hypothetical protein